MAFRYFSTQENAIGYAQSLYAEQGYEHFAAIAAAEELVRYAFRWPGEYVNPHGVVARYTLMGGYSVGTAVEAGAMSTSDGLGAEREHHEPQAWQGSTPPIS